jgi:hypothetical protein
MVYTMPVYYWQADLYAAKSVRDSVSLSMSTETSVVTSELSPESLSLLR